MLLIGAPIEAKGTAEAIAQGIKGAITTTEFSKASANFCLSFSKSLQS